MIVHYDDADRMGPGGIGAKAATIARLSRFGFAVPDGFAIDSDAARDAFGASAALIERVADLSLADLATPDARRLLASVRAAIESADTKAGGLESAIEHALSARSLTDAPMAVRSSATGEDGAARSFAGMHDSVLSVRGAVAVSKAVRRCQASLFTERAVAYRRVAGIPDGSVRPGILVCRMVEPATAGVPFWSGVTFTIDPTTGDRDRFVIEAVEGIGTALVSGTATPVRAVYDLRKRTTAFSPGWPDVLTGTRFDALIMLMTRLHWTLGRGEVAQDIEWAFDGVRFVILQCRPVTRHPDRRFTALESDQRIWSDSNLREVFPDQLSPFAWSLLSYGTRWAVFDPYRSVGYPVPSGMKVVCRKGGRAYLDIHALQWAAFDAFGVAPEAFTRDVGGHHPDLVIPDGHAGRGAAARRGLRGLRLLLATWWQTRSLNAAFSRIRAEAAAEAETPPEAMTLEHAKALWERTERQMLATPFLVASGAGPLWMAVAEQVHAASARGADPRADLSPLLNRAIASIAGAVPALLTLAEARSAWPERWAAFVREHGHRGFAEMDLATARWREQESFLKDYVQAIVPSGAQPMPAEPGPTRSPSRLTAFFVRQAIRGYGLREDAKSTLVALLGNFRLVALSVGHRLAAHGWLENADDVFALSAADVKSVVDGSWTGEGAAALVAYSRAYERAETVPEQDRPSWFAEGASVESGTTRIANEPGKVLRGIGVSSGNAVGIARVLSSPTDAEQLATGEILVAAATDPGWTPLFAKAAAVVTERGGFLSHAAIVARELDVPAVVNVPDARRRITSGMRLRVDGGRGTVTILGEEQGVGPGSARLARSDHEEAPQPII